MTLRTRRRGARAHGRQGAGLWHVGQKAQGDRQEGGGRSLEWLAHTPNGLGAAVPADVISAGARGVAKVPANALITLYLSNFLEFRNASARRVFYSAEAT